MRAVPSEWQEEASDSATDVVVREPLASRTMWPPESPSASVANIIALQRSSGNAAVVRQLNGSTRRLQRMRAVPPTPVPPTPAPGATGGSPAVQPAIEPRDVLLLHIEQEMLPLLTAAEELTGAKYGLPSFRARVEKLLKQLKTGTPDTGAIDDIRTELGLVINWFNATAGRAGWHENLEQLEAATATQTSAASAPNGKGKRAFRPDTQSSSSSASAGPSAPASAPPQLGPVDKLLRILARQEKFISLTAQETTTPLDARFVAELLRLVRILKTAPKTDYDADATKLSEAQANHLVMISDALIAIAALIIDEMERDPVDCFNVLSFSGFFGLLLPLLRGEKRCNVESGTQLEIRVLTFKTKTPAAPSEPKKKK